MSVTIIYKNGSLEDNLAGITVAEALKIFQPIFNIPPNVIPCVNNFEVNFNHILKDEDVLRLFNYYPMH